MAVQTVFSDTLPNGWQTDVKFGKIRRVYFNATIGATGAITVTASLTSGSIAATRTSAGLYALTGLPTGGALAVLLAHGAIINNDGSADVAGGRVVTWSDISLTLGTANILVTAGDDGSNEDSADGTRLQAILDLKCGS